VKRLNPATIPAGQHELFAAYRYHAVFTNSTASILTAEAEHRDHAIVERCNPDGLPSRIEVRRTQPTRGRLTRHEADTARMSSLLTRHRGRLPRSPVLPLRTTSPTPTASVGPATCAVQQGVRRAALVGLVIRPGRCEAPAVPLV